MALKRIPFHRIPPAFCLLCLIYSCHKETGMHPVDMVYPWLDAAHSRWFYFSSACRPFGLVSLFPDNRIDGEWNSGYRYDIDTILDFSHIHEWQLAGVAVMPVTFFSEDPAVVLEDYASAFSHESEIVKPGYHAVDLKRYSIHVELTATLRTGIHRYTFPPRENAGIIFNLGGHLGPSDMIEGGFSQISDHEIRGYVVNGPTIRRIKSTPVYYTAVFSQSVKDIFLYANDSLYADVDRWNGCNGKILVCFGDLAEPLSMKVGISYTSEEGAFKNLLAEMPGWDLEHAKSDAEDHWNSMLSRITIEGGTEKQQRRFYTDLWHAIQGRRIISDADGKYTDLTGGQLTIRQLPLDEKGNPRFNMYNSDAFWGVQWTLNTLWQLVYPEIASEFCNSFLEYYKNGGLVPRGPSGGNYTYVMTGASTTPFFVSAWQKGIRNFDGDLAYEALKKNHMPGGLMSKAGYEHHTAKGGGIEYYMERGYVPYPLSDTLYGSHQDGAGMTLENAYQDWCLAQFAKALGKNADFEYLMSRAGNFVNLFDTVQDYMVPKDKKGNWKSPYDPLLYDHGFVEGNGAQFTWFVPHDLQTLFDLMGGSDSAVAHLNRQFEASRSHRFCNEHPELTDHGGSEKYINDRRTFINYSNQPNTHAAFIFNHAGAPWLSQYWSRTIVDSVFSSLSPWYGYNGDEDQGLMGALAVLMKIGIFQMTGGCESNPVYELGSPLFDKVTITLHPRYYQGHELVIETLNNAPDSPYIKQATINGKPLNSCFFRHSELLEGARIAILMSPFPNKSRRIPENECQNNAKK
ncbi:MAG: GH92 family glycosyl hydrolase [Bacteroidales bacterium]|nr:GH92 family glycosyl hydrolase [Bacteroidales bacterium]